jgi:hypothetical protein
MTAPLASVTVPSMVDVVVCAVAPAAAISRTAIIRNTPETLVGISCSSTRRDLVARR